MPDALTHETEPDGYHIVSDNTLLVYGDGETFLDAWLDYLVSLVELVRLMRQDELLEITQ